MKDDGRMRRVRLASSFGAPTRGSSCNYAITVAVEPRARARAYGAPIIRCEYLNKGKIRLCIRDRWACPSLALFTTFRCFRLRFAGPVELRSFRAACEVCGDRCASATRPGVQFVWAGDADLEHTPALEDPTRTRYWRADRLAARLTRKSLLTDCPALSYRLYPRDMPPRCHSFRECDISAPRPFLLPSCGCVRALGFRTH